MNVPAVLPVVQLFVAAGVDATCIPDGKGSLTDTFVRFERSAAEAEITSVNVDGLLGAMFAGVNDLVIDGDAFPETTRLALLVSTLLFDEHPPPRLFDTVTLKLVVLGGVSAKVVIVRVDVVLPLETVVGLNTAVTSALGGVQLICNGFEVQPRPVPDHCEVIGNVVELP